MTIIEEFDIKDQKLKNEILDIHRKAKILNKIILEMKEKLDIEKDKLLKQYPNLSPYEGYFDIDEKYQDYRDVLIAIDLLDMWNDNFINNIETQFQMFDDLEL